MPGKLIIVVLIVAIGIWVMNRYNQLIKVREMVRNARGQIAAQLESRWDAVSNLIDAAKDYGAYEAETLGNVIAQRGGLKQNPSVNELEEDASAFDRLLGRFIAIAEAYPELKASMVYQDAMDSIRTYEDNVRHSRMIYNDMVTKMNRTVQTFPTSIVASTFGFGQEEYFRASEDKEQAPTWN